MGYIDTQLFINGKWQPPAEGKTLPVLNPATGREIGRVAHAGRPDLEIAVEAAQKGLVHEAVPGKALDRAMEIARRLASHTPQSIRHIKRLVRNAVETPLDRGLQLERNLFMDLCGGDEAIARMRAYESKRITDPAQGLRL